jgi:hypothetical protein
VQKAVRQLASSGDIFLDQGYVILRKDERKMQSLLKRRAETDIFTEVKRQQAELIQKKLSWIPWISAVFFTGSVAAKNAVQSDDIDLCVITKKNRMWLTRFCVVLWTKLLRKYRLRGTRKAGEVSDMWCFNLWLDDAHLVLPAQIQTLYGAHELFFMKTVFDRDSLHTKIIANNGWAEQYLANRYTELRQKHGGVVIHESFPNTGPLYWLKERFLDVLEGAVRWIQRLFIDLHGNHAQISPGHAAFFPRNFSQEKLNMFTEEMASLSKSS